MISCNSMYVNEAGLMDAIQQFLVKAMEPVEEKWLEALQMEIMFAGAGKTKWREEAGKAFKEVERNIAQDYIEMKIGLDSSLASYSEDLFVRIQVALFGNQAQGPITSKPGAMVYGNDIQGKHLSNAKTMYAIPQFDQTADGDEMMKNAKQLTEKFFRDALRQAAASLPDAIFYDNLIVVGG